MDVARVRHGRIELELQPLALAEVLQEAAYVVTTRKTRGDDIDAACGQLAGKVQDKTKRTQRKAEVVE